MVSSLEIAQATESWSTDDRETKKVGFKERDGEADVEMVVDLDSQPKVSWKQMLLEKVVSNQEEGSRSSKVECTEGFEFLEGDVIKDCQRYSDYRVFGLYTTNFDRGYGSNSGTDVRTLDDGGAEIPSVTKGSTKSEGERYRKEILRSIFLALKGLENLEIRKDEMDYMILVGEGEKLKGNGKMAAQISRKSKEGFKNGIAGNWGDSNFDLGSGILEAGSRPEVTFGKIKEIINQSKVSGGPSSLTNGHNETELAVTDLGVNKLLENSFSDPSKFSNSSSNSNMTITHFTPTFEESEGAVVVLDRNVLDLGKQSTIVFEEAPSSKKGQVLGDGGNYGVGKEVLIPKVRGSSDKYGTS
ncbi:hypothetical protein Goshw_009086 [Gossypium schwendimanii]|uniref:Uncharacterized protein n=1 Tax=Gossypium schwendimanii TaxID=34291 RepID=A0A7J9NDC4_GOSSC|nr:hypothetical protein [Gossypium schwendimanii]